MTSDPPRWRRVAWKELPARALHARLRWKILAALVLLVVLARAVLPFALESAAAWIGPRELGLPVEVANIDLALMGGRVALEGVAVGRAEEVGSEAPIDPAQALLRWDRIFANFEWTRLLRGELALRRLEIDGPVVRLVREPDGRIDPLAHRPPRAPEAEAAEAGEAAAGEPWPVRVESFALRQASATVLETGATAVLASFGVGELTLGDISVEGSQVGLGELGIRNPRVHAIRSFAFAPAPRRAPAQAPPSPPAPAPAAPAAEAPAGAEGATPAPAAPESGYHVAKIEIQAADLELESEAGSLEMALSMLAREVSLDAGSRFPLDLTIEMGGGRLNFKGEVGLVPIVAQGRLVWSDLPMPPFMLVGEPRFVPWLRSCRAGGQLDVVFRTQAGPRGEPPGLHASGPSHVADFSFGDPDSHEISLAFERLEVETRSLDVPLAAPGAKGPAPPPRFEIGAFRLVAPEIRWVQPATQLEKLLAGEVKPAVAAGEAAPPTEPQPAQPAATAAPGQPPEISVASLAIEKGNLVFLDRTPSPPVETTVHDFSLTAQNLRWPERSVKGLNLAAFVAGSGGVSLRGDLTNGAGKLKLALEHLPLLPFDPYVSGSGYHLAAGEASLDSDIEIGREVYDLDNQLELNQLRVDVGDDAGRFQKQFGIPLDVALALLRDPRGDINLPLPLKVEAKGARVGLAPVVRGALRQALVGAMSSPLKAVGFVLPKGGSPAAAFEPIAFAPGQAQVRGDEDDHVEALTKLMAARPTLGLELLGSAGDDDRPRVAEAILLEKAEKGKDWPDVEGSSWLARRRLRGALEERAEGKKGKLDEDDQALLERTAAAVRVPDERLVALAQARAEALQQALVAEGVAPERLRVGTPTAPGPPQVRVGLFAL